MSPGAPGTAYFRIVTDGESRNLEVEPLYSELPGLTEDLTRFLLENLVLQGESSDPGDLYEAFLGLKLDETGQITTYMYAGAARS